MVTIAFAFIVAARHHRVEGSDRRPERPDGPRAADDRRTCVRRARDGAVCDRCSPASRSTCSIGLPRAPGARRWSRCATARPRRARSGSIRSSIKTAAFAVSAVFAGLAGAIFAPLMMFVAPDSFPFSQSILFLLAVIVGGAGWVFGPVVGAVVTVMLPELLSEPRRVSPAVRRCAAARRAVARARRRDRHAGALCPPDRPCEREAQAISTLCRIPVAGARTHSLPSRTSASRSAASRPRPTWLHAQRPGASPA